MIEGFRRLKVFAVDWYLIIISFELLLTCSQHDGIVD